MENTISHLIKLANILDSTGNSAEAMQVDEMISKLSGEVISLGPKMYGPEQADRWMEIANDHYKASEYYIDKSEDTVDETERHRDKPDWAKTQSGELTSKNYTYYMNMSMAHEMSGHRAYEVHKAVNKLNEDQATMEQVQEKINKYNQTYENVKKIESDPSEEYKMTIEPAQQHNPN